AVDGDISKNRSTGNVHVPNAVMDELVMPLSLARVEIGSDQTFTKQTISRTVSAIVVAGRQLNWQVNGFEFFIDADLSPNPCVACVRRGVVFPRLISVFICERNGVKNPQSLSGFDVETTNVAFDIALASRHSSGFERRADNYDIFCDNRSRVQSDLP